MHAKSDLRVVLKWLIYRSDSVITDVMSLKSSSGRIIQMANPDVLNTEGFLFPLDEDAAESLRNADVDERTWLEVVEVPRSLQMTIRGRIVRRSLRKSGVSVWPIGELPADVLVILLGGLKEMRTEKTFSKDQADLANRIISLLEMAAKDRRSVWLNF